MSKKDDLKLDVLSGIDEDIIERTSQKRLLLMNGGRRRRQRKTFLISGIAAAACLCIVITTLLVQLLPGVTPSDGRQVPIYQGMTVSTDAPDEQANLYGTTPYMTLSANNVVPHIELLDNSGNNGNGNSQNAPGHNKPADDVIADEVLRDPPKVTGTSEKMYYALPNQDIYITVHFHNPDNFEILSFTLNGMKYSSYMFEDGSDMENLVLKVNVGDVEGIIEYTIDAIKYVDGTAIKDVIIDGDKTVNVGVFTQKQPAATVALTTVGVNKISLNLSISDEMNLLGISNGFVKAVLTEGENIVDMQDISLGEDISVTFTGLHSNTKYKYSIVATYDALDGLGFTSYVLYEGEISTSTFLNISVLGATSEETSFDFSSNEDGIIKAITDIIITDKNGDVVTDGDPDLRSYNNLTPRETYTLSIVFEYDFNDGNGVRTGTESIEIYIAPLSKIPYTVKHYVEELDGSYTLMDTEILNGEEAASVSPSTKSYTGFTSPKAQSATIARDGSTVIEYRYARSFYTVTYFTGNGDKIDSWQGKYGQSLPEYPTASREGYTFGGWFTDADLTKDATTHLTTLPAEDVTVYAWWKEEIKPSEFSYTTKDGIATITKLSSDKKDIRVPAYIGSAPVEEIQVGALSECTEVESIALPFIGYNRNANENDGENRDKHIGYIFNANGIGDAPESLHTVTVTNATAIHPNSFQECYYIKHIILCDTVRELREYSFFKCYNLESIRLPEGLSVIGIAAFQGCEELHTVNIPSTVTVLGMYAFAECKSIEEIVLPDGLSIMEPALFQNCTSLKHVTLPKGIKEIPNVMFEFCESLRSITLTEGIESIGFRAFACCDKLTHINIPSSVQYIDDAAFQMCKELTGHIIIPEGLSVIGSSVFSNCTKLEGVTIPNSVISIESDAFWNCSSLTELVIPDSVTKIGASAFFGCSSLTSITIPDGVRSISDSTFSGCSSLTSITIPDSVMSIGDSAFSACTGLTSITIGNSVKNISPYMFFGCSNLTSITIPDGVTSIGDYAFQNCTNLSSITIPDSVTIIGAEAFYGCAVTNVHITDIGAWCNINFYDRDSNPLRHSGNLYLNDELVTDLVIPDGVNRITAHAFFKCTNLTSVTIPDSVMSIGDNAFSSCTGLTSITIGNSVMSIGKHAFNNCKALTSVTFENPSGWNAGGEILSASSLSNASTAATYLKSTYRNAEWIRN